MNLTNPPYEDLGDPEPIRPLFADRPPKNFESWEDQREVLKTELAELVGSQSFDLFNMKPEQVDSFERPEYTGTVYKQPTGPDSRQTVLVMEPKRIKISPRPGMVIPFYHPDAMAGIDLENHTPILEDRIIQFGLHLVQQGYVVVCSEAFPYNTVEEPEDNTGFAWWEAAARKLLTDHPDWTGIGKLVWDNERAMDLLLDQQDIDHDMVGVMGHSLGGKIAFYSGVMDERVRATVCSDFGMGYSFTNWDAPWYLGDRIHRPEFTLAHHHLLAIHAPRPFLLVGGEADRPASWQYINEAKQAYALYGKEDAVGFFDHASGHRPTPESLNIAYTWLANQFNLEEQSWVL
jgi:dienelactone hydrolase